MTCSKLFYPIFFSFLLLSAAACASSSISYDQKKADIESLRSYEATHGSPTLVADQKKKKIPEFVCDADEPTNCNQQRVMYQIKHRQEPVFIAEGKYKVDLFFVNDGDFPYKNLEAESFESISTEEEGYFLNQIFEHYLGNEFDSYSPKILNVNKSTVGIAILVASSEELDVFLDDSRVVGIYHIGNNRYVEEGY